MASEMSGRNTLRCGGDSLGRGDGILGEAPPAATGFFRRVTLRSVQGQEPEVAQEHCPVRLQAARRAAVVDRPHFGIFQRIDRLDPAAPQSDIASLALQPVVPGGNGEAVFGRGIEAGSELTVPPSLVEGEIDIRSTVKAAAPAAIGADAVGCGLAGVMPGSVVDRRGFSLGGGSDEVLKGERVRVVRWPRGPAAVIEEDAELGQFEDGGVDPAAIDERRVAEERDRHGGERGELSAETSLERTRRRTCRLIVEEILARRSCKSSSSLGWSAEQFHSRKVLGSLREAQDRTWLASAASTAAAVWGSSGYANQLVALDSS